MYQLAWYRSHPGCWVASVDGGRRWTMLKADDEDDWQDALKEAVELYGVSSIQWTVRVDPVLNLLES